jgi:parallel beta-helix repeat protein
MKRIAIIILTLVFLFACGKGEQGEKGDPGATGPQGERGAQGDQGTSGDPGTYATCTVSPGGDIQPCIDDVLNNGGGEVIVSAGTYTITNYIHIWGSNLALRGEGADTKLYLADGIQTSVIVAGPVEPMNPDEDPSLHPLTNITIENLSIDGNKDNQASEDWPAPYNYIKTSGITVRHAQSVTIRNVTVLRARSAGILVEKSTDGYIVDRVEIRESFFDGFSCNKSYHGEITNSRLSQNTAAGITATCDCSENTFSDNELFENGSHGIFFAEAHRNLITNNIMSGNLDVGIFLKGTDCGVTSTGASENYFLQNSIISSASCGVFLTSAADGTPGTGNVAIETLYYQNGYDGVCNYDASLYEEIDPIIAALP